MKSPSNPDNSRYRRSLRFKDYDYSTPGAYFITIVTQSRLSLFGHVCDERMLLNAAGKILWETWRQMPNRFPTIKLDEFIIMPNHIHGILIIHSPAGAPLVGAFNANVVNPAHTIDGKRATTRVAPTGEKTVTLGEVVGAYKSLTTRLYGQGVNTKGWLPYENRLWQHNYYERVIRNAKELERAREYIANNPAKWDLDSENPITSRPL